MKGGRHQEKERAREREKHARILNVSSFILLSTSQNTSQQEFFREIKTYKQTKGVSEKSVSKDEFGGKKDE